MNDLILHLGPPMSEGYCQEHDIPLGIGGNCSICDLGDIDEIIKRIIFEHCRIPSEYFSDPPTLPDCE